MSTFHSDTKKILRSGSMMSLGTLASRSLGFVRDVLLAHFFGTTAGLDAFIVAFRIPNLFRDILGEGAANSSFVPVATEVKLQRKEAFQDFLNAMLIWAVMILTGVVLLGALLAPLIVRIIAPGFSQDSTKLALAIQLTQIMFPYLIAIALTAFFSGIQFVFGSFRAPAFGPCLLNIVLIGTILLSAEYMETPLLGLGVGVLLGGIVQMFFQWSRLKKYGIVFAWPKKLENMDVSQVGRLLLPRIFGTAVYQLNVFVDTICASLGWIVGTGAVSAVYYANRIIFLPLGVFGVALMTASLPIFSKHAVEKDHAALKQAIMFSLKKVIMIMVPVTAGLLLFAKPLVRLVFERGAFDSSSTEITASALFFYALGLTAFASIKVLAAAFHAMKDTKTPVKIAAGCLLLNVVLNIILIFPMKIGGVALASSVAASVNAGLLFFILQKRLGKFV